MTHSLPIADIQIGERHRIDAGDIGELADFVEASLDLLANPNLSTGEKHMFLVLGLWDWMPEAEQTYFPSNRDISAASGIGLRQIQYLLDSMGRKGLIGIERGAKNPTHRIIRRLHEATQTQPPKTSSAS